MINKTFIIKEDDVNKRIDAFLSYNISTITRTFIQKQIEVEEKKILINNKEVKSNYKLKLNDIVHVDFEAPKPKEINPECISLDVVYEDDDILIVNKDKGMVVHPAQGHLEKTLVNALLFYCKENLSYYHEDKIRPGIVHRIDKDTSGLLVVAKNNHSHEFLKAQFKEHSITRKYYAIIFGNLKNDLGTINKNLGRSLKDRKKVCIDESGKSAITHYKVLERFKKYTFVELLLETGRTHQIRVHMASIGHPVVGDVIYSKTKQPFKVEGQVLHAKTLGLIHPSKGYMEFDSELPDYFQEILIKI